VASKLRALDERLIEDTLVRRYEVESTHVDGLPGKEGSFTACSFWYVECLARAGELEKAQLLFEKLLGYANHLGLYSEELGSNGAAPGEFPSGIHAPGPDQRGNLSGSGPFGKRRGNLALTTQSSPSTASATGDNNFHEYSTMRPGGLCLH
jgi:GH15 family glucan-1,4-alpha-glucosidase